MNELPERMADGASRRLDRDVIKLVVKLVLIFGGILLVAGLILAGLFWAWIVHALRHGTLAH
mgnify:CR=1